MYKENSNYEKSTNLLLDSSLIVTTILYDKATKLYDLKVIDCNNYIQVYAYENKNILRKKDKDNISNNQDKINKMFSKENLVKFLNKNEILNNISNENDNLNKQKSIEQKNINRSRLECQRIAKANAEYWKSFITLTIAENISDVKIANKKFRNYIDKVKRVVKDFKYLGVIEFQERGAIHYHLLTNLECDSKLIPKHDLKRLYNPKSKTWKELEYYDLKYWNEGFSSAETIESDIKKIVGYISKYFTKNIDNRLYNRHRYFYSRNLKKPTINYLDLSNPKHMEFYKNILSQTNLIYKNEYISEYDNSKVTFFEYVNNN